MIKEGFVKYKIILLEVMPFFKGIKIVLKYEAWQKVIQPNNNNKKKN